MDIRKLQRAIVDGLEDVKAQDIVVFNTEHLSPLFERVIIASGTSSRQANALASSVRNKVRGQGGTVLATEGTDNGEWIIVDCGAAVAHILQPALRHYYHLEELWGGKPVNVKLATVSRGLVKASESEAEEEETAAPPPAARRATAKKAAPAPKPVSAKTRTASKAVKKPAQKTAQKAAKSTARSSASLAKPPARKAAAKTTPRRAAPSTAGKAPAGKTAARSAAPARKAASKKTSKSLRRA